MRSRLRSRTASALLGACAALALPGCALVVRGTQQDIQVDAVSADGKALDGVECRAGDAVAAAPAGISAPRLTVRRSGDDLSVRCLSQGRVVASAKVISRSDMGLISLAVGGVLSATIDHLSGAAFAYPGWITLVAGEERSYDRRDSAEGPSGGIFVSRLGAGAPGVSGAVALTVAPVMQGPNYYRANYSVTASQLLRPGARRTGRDTYNAEKLALAMQCSATPRAVLIERGAGFEVHRVPCTARVELSVRCEFGNCRVQPAALPPAGAIAGLSPVQRLPGP
jgi:hypothetical protein